MGNFAAVDTKNRNVYPSMPMDVYERFIFSCVKIHLKLNQVIGSII